MEVSIHDVVEIEIHQDTIGDTRIPITRIRIQVKDLRANSTIRRKETIWIKAFTVGKPKGTTGTKNRIQFNYEGGHNDDEDERKKIKGRIARIRFKASEDDSADEDTKIIDTSKD